MEREPKSLYQLAIRRIADQNVPGDIVLRKHKNELTVEMIFDICAELNERLSRSKKAGKSLGMFMSNLDIFLEFLQLGHKRMTLHKIFESINSLESHDKKLSQVLTEIFVERLQDSSLQYPSCVHVGLNFASFLSASGWYEEAIDVLRALNESFSNVFPVETQVSLNFRLLHAFSEYRRFDMAEKVLQKLSQMADNQMFKITPQQMCEISNYYYWRSLYPDAHSWSMRAVRKITAMTPSRMIIDVLRQAGKLKKKSTWKIVVLFFSLKGGRASSEDSFPLPNCFSAKLFCIVRRSLEKNTSNMQTACLTMPFTYLMWTRWGKVFKPTRKFY